MFDSLEHDFGFQPSCNNADLDYVMSLKVPGDVSDNLPYFSAIDKLVRNESKPVSLRYVALRLIDEFNGVEPINGEVPSVAINNYIDLVMA
jgi:hypothetical protein